MYEIAVHESAEEELIAAALYYESRETDLGEEFLSNLVFAVAHVRRRPGYWRHRVF